MSAPDGVARGGSLRRLIRSMRTGEHERFLALFRVRPVRRPPPPPAPDPPPSCEACGDELVVVVGDEERPCYECFAPESRP